MIEDDRRACSRIVVDETHGLSFTLQDRTFYRLPMTNLSVKGCCIRVPAALGKVLSKGDILEKAVLAHPKLPDYEMKAIIRWIMGKQEGKFKGEIFLGLEFFEIPDDVAICLEQHLANLLVS